LKLQGAAVKPSVEKGSLKSNAFASPQKKSAQTNQILAFIASSDWYETYLTNIMQSEYAKFQYYVTIRRSRPCISE